MSDDMQEINILLPGVYQTAMRTIENLYPMDSTQLAMIAITVGSCIIQAKNTWTLTDFNRLEEDLKHARNQANGK
jgi:hypothetical protein